MDVDDHIWNTGRYNMGCGDARTPSDEALFALGLLGIIGLYRKAGG